jgi:dipeptidyl aminopeptidase/acylaminoacyl peptidase
MRLALAVGVLAVLAFAALAPLGAASPSPAAPRARIAFESDYAIYTIASDGSARRRLTSGRSFTGRIADADPRWAPNGRLIGFTRYLVEKPGTADESSTPRVRVIRPDGSGLRAVVPDPGKRADDRFYGWTPRGQLMFSRYSYPDRRATLYAVDPDGRNMRKLLGGRDLLPRFSPDGKRLLFTRGHYDKDYFWRPSVWIARADGTHAKRLLADAGDPAWSPDGRRIAVRSIRDRNGYTCDSDYCEWHGEIYTVDRGGGGARRITRNQGHDQNPRWTADGKRIVFDSNRNFRVVEWTLNPEVYSVGADGSCLTWLTNGSAWSETPDPEPDPEASSDPGECGAAHRAPVVDVDLSEASRARGFTPYWMGERAPGGMIPSFVMAAHPNWFGLSYNDCRFFFPGRCIETPAVESKPTCEAADFLLRSATPSRLVMRRGAVAHIPGLGYDPDGAYVYAGDTTVNLSIENAYTKEGLALLAPLHERPAGDLPATAFPRYFWRALKRAEDDYGRTRDYDATARNLGIPRSAVKRRVGLAKRLRKLGVDGRLECRGGRVTRERRATARRPVARRGP